MMMYEREDINEILLNYARAMLHRNEQNNGGEKRKLEKEEERINKKVSKMDILDAEFDDNIK